MSYTSLRSMRIGRPPEFNGGFSRTTVRLRLSRAQWQAIEQQAEAEGKTFREFLKMRLRRALADVLDDAQTEGGGRLMDAATRNRPMDELERVREQIFALHQDYEQCCSRQQFGEAEAVSWEIDDLEHREEELLGMFPEVRYWPTNWSRPMEV